MEIKVNEDDRIRIEGGYGSISNFIDVSKEGFSGIGITLFASFQYIEIRRKEGLIRVFTFPKKSHKKEYDFKHWADAEVILAINEQIMNKD